MTTPIDLLIIGGGINGAGIARDAAGRGLSVTLVEKDDLASHTSSASTKLVHGGLRYLEHFEFRLVRESLIERERLLKIAPHIIWPLRFVLPHDAGLRPKWMLRLGLFLYDNLGGRKLLPPTRTLDLRAAPHGQILEDRLIKGFEYSDCWVEDSRLVALNCLDARERGATIRTRTECIGLERRADHWVATLRHGDDAQETLAAKQVVNAAGPWVDTVLGRALPSERHQNLRLVKGSHLIFPRLFDGDHCYIFQNKDDRIIFAIPYERDFTLVGTTDQSFEGDPSGIEISDEEARYICDAASEYLRVDVSPDQAVSSYAGVRPLYDDSSSSNSTVTRDYVFELDRGENGEAPPLLSIFGGKITTYRKLAEHALEKLGVGGGSWTADKALPGGDIDPHGYDQFVAEKAREYSWLPAGAVERLARAYGSRIDDVLGGAQGLNDLGPHLGGDLYAGELEYLMASEFATSAEDVLWRRSKLGVHLDAQAQQRVRDWFEKAKIAA
ncbi:MAG: glycerol-3-phosphate dehydrogenase [Pseudomonadota bacterium]